MTVHEQEHQLADSLVVLVGRRYKLRDPLGKTMENIYAENDLYGRFR